VRLLVILEPPREVGPNILRRVGRERLGEPPAREVRVDEVEDRGQADVGTELSGRELRPVAAKQVIVVHDPVRQQWRKCLELVNADRLNHHRPHLRARIRDPRAHYFDRLRLGIARGEKQCRVIAARLRPPGRLQQWRDNCRTFQCREFFGGSFDDLLELVVLSPLSCPDAVEQAPNRGDERRVGPVARVAISGL